MNTTEQNQSLEPAPAKPPVKMKREKPAFGQFIELLEEAVHEPGESNGVEKIVQLIQVGINGDFTPQNVERTSALIMSSSFHSAVALKLGVQVSLGKLKGFQRETYNEMQRLVRNSLSYPFLNNSVPQSFVERWKKLEEWMYAHAHSGSLSVKQAQDLLVCLLVENLNWDSFLAIHEIVQMAVENQGGKPPKKNGKRTKYTGYLQGVVKKLAVTKVPLGSIKSVLSTTRPFETEFSELSRDYRNVTTERDALSKQLEETKSQLQQLQDEYDGKVRTIDELRSSLASSETAKKQREEQYAELEAYWGKECKRLLVGQAYDIKKYLSHELDQAQKSLHGNPPAIDMACNRLQRIEEFIRNLGNSNE